MQNLNEIIKQAISKIDLDADDVNNQITIVLKLCDIALKVKRLEEEKQEDEDLENYKFNPTELSIIEDYLKDLKTQSKKD